MKIGRNDRCSCGSGRKYKVCCSRTSAFEGDYQQQPIGVPGGKAVLESLRSAFDAYHPISDDGLGSVVDALKQGTIIIRPSLQNSNDVLVLGLINGARLFIRHCNSLSAVKDIQQQLRKEIPGRMTVVLAEDESESSSAQELQHFLQQDSFGLA